jgi:hypothetical protein
LADLIAWAAARGAVVVAETTDRYVRHERYTNLNQDLQATLEQMQEVSRIAGDVKLFTRIDPDATPSECRSAQIERGQDQKGQKGGGNRKKEPGWKKELREAKKPEARKMLKRGMSYGQIGKALGVNRRTVWGWLND